MEQLTVKTITDELTNEYPYELAMEWDNPGLQVGRIEAPVTKVLVALDATDPVIARCAEEGVQLLLTHHPLTMQGIRQFNEGDLTGRRVLALAENRVAHFAMHTNYDVVTMGQLAGDMMCLEQQKILEVTATTDKGEYGIGRVGLLPAWCTAASCCEKVKEVFGLDGIRLFGDPQRKVRYIAVSPGSGKSMIEPALHMGVDLLVTGDIGHHDGLDAVAKGLLVADAGHYGIEHIFVKQMGEWMRERFPELDVLEMTEQEPYITI